MFIDPSFLASQVYRLTKIRLFASLVDLVPKVELSMVIQAKAKLSKLAKFKARFGVAMVRLARALARC